MRKNSALLLCILLLLPMPTPVVRAQATSGLAAALSIASVKTYGAKGDGTTVDGTAIVAAMNANPSGTVYFPAGTYILNNAAAATGLTIPTTFAGKLLFAPGAAISCNTATTSAGMCLYMTGTSNVTIDGMTITYTGAGSLPLARVNSTFDAAYIYSNTNVTLLNMTVIGATGPCVWTDTNTTITVMNLRVKNCTADGLHFENSTNVIVDGLWSSNTGDDGLAFTSLSTSTQVCGGTVSNVHVQNGSARGIAVVGGCDIAVSDFDINNTYAPGLYVSAESGYHATSHVKFANGFVTNGGALTISGTHNSSNSWGAQVATASYVDFDNVQIISPYGDGFETDSTVDHVNIKNSTVVNAQLGSGGGGGMVIMTCSHCDLSNDRLDTIYSDGFYSNASSDLNITNLVIRNSSTNTGSGLNRAFWNETESGPVTTTGLEIIDDQGTPTGYIVGDFNNGSNPVLTTGIASKITGGSLTVQGNTGTSTAAAYIMAGAGAPPYVVATGSVNVLAGSLSPAASFPYLGMEVKVLPNLANTTTTPTFNLNGNGADTITKNGHAALAVGDLSTTAIADLIFDGTDWQLLNPQTLLGLTGNIATTGSVSSGSSPPACTAGTAGANCLAEGTAPTNVSATAALYADSTTHELEAATNGASTFGVIHRSVAVVHQTGKTAAITTATLCAASAGACNIAGEYHVHWDIYQTGTACSAVTAGQLVPSFNWTGPAGTAITANTVPFISNLSTTALVQSWKPVVSALTAWASGDFTISTNGSIIQYAVAYTACTTGTLTYQFDATVTRLQ